MAWELQVWKWLLLFSVASIFFEIVLLLAGLTFLGFAIFGIDWEHWSWFPVVATLIAAWRQKAGRRMLGLLGSILIVLLIQSEVLASFAFSGGAELNTYNLWTVAHRVTALVLYTLALATAMIAVRKSPVAPPIPSN